MIKATKTYKALFCAVIFLLLFCAVFVSAQGLVNVAYASDKVEYSNVLDDLKKDSTFDVKNYPVSTGDYSLKIIQLAESVDKELFVYVYQPSGTNKMRASSINISTTAYVDITPSNYKLKYINSSGVFFKYVVEGITVSTAEARYYGVTSIYRPFDESIDEQAEHGNKIVEVPYAISKEYRFFTINGNLVTATVDIETIEITEKFVGFVRYDDGFVFHKEACDSHFVAFDTDKPIDRLIEADVSWIQQSYYHVPTPGFESTRIGDDVENINRTLSEDDETVTHHGNGIFAGTYSWDRIQTISDFISSVDMEQTVYSGAIIDVKAASKITNEGKAALQDKKWVLRFAETSFEEQTREGLMNGIRYTYRHQSSTLVGEVTILRLKFVTDGITYNLGVIDNKQSGGDKPINDTELDVELNDNWKWILPLILTILLLILFAPLLPYIIKAVIWVVTLPFRVIGAIVKGLKKSKSQSKNNTNKKSNKGKG